VIRSPIVMFELRHGTPDLPLIKISGVNLSTLSNEESGEVYMRVRSAAEKGSAFAMCLCATCHMAGHPWPR